MSEGDSLVIVATPLYIVYVIYQLAFVLRPSSETLSGLLANAPSIGPSFGDLLQSSGASYVDPYVCSASGLLL